MSRCFNLTGRDEIIYDDWLVQYLPLLTSTDKPVIDLGCGSGNDTLFLVENKIDVIPCDISHSVIENMRRNFPELTRIEKFDMTGGLPFSDSFSDIVIADLSLHFFDDRTTHFVLGEIKRVLTEHGTLLFRLNSAKDARHDSGSGKEVSPGFFILESGAIKRFFDEPMLHEFFSGWQLSPLIESVMNRYAKPKTLWSGYAKPKT